MGSYRLVQKLGEGGMGEVFIGEHQMLGRRAAVKVLRPEFSHRQDIVARFFNEARAATQISDPGIVQIFDFGQAQDGSAYIVMELLDGETMDRRMVRQQVLPIPEALRLVRQVASSLATAHSRGIVHRDLKPENIFIVRDPEVAGGERTKILDFGIAKLYGDQQVKTHTSAVMGTPTYMSPEQCRGSGQVDHRADIYSLGCVLYLLVTGRMVFEAEGTGDLIAMHLREQPIPPSAKAQWVPAALDRLILRCLAKNPGERFQTGTELASAITSLLETGTLPQMPSSPNLAPTVAVAALQSKPPTTLSSASGAVGARSMPPPRKKTGLVLGFVGTVAIGAVIAVVALTRKGGNDATTTTPAPATQPAAIEPPKVEPPKVEPPKVEPPVEAKTEPLKVEPPKVEPPKVEPPVEAKTEAKTEPETKTVRKDPKTTPSRPKQPKQPKQPTGGYVDTDGDGIPDKR
jgi:serine/threonine protein kinase